MYTSSIEINRYETWELDALLAQIERPNPWLLNTFFPTQRFFESKQIEFDLIDRGRRLAPFVSPLVAGKPMLREGYRTRQLQPAYIKPTDLIVPTDSFVRRPGEAYGGASLSPQQRFDIQVQETLSLHEQSVDNRLEWMAAQALVNGSIIIQGDDYPKTLVDFGRDSSLTIALTGGAKWDQTTSDPMSDIETSSLLVRKVSKGAVVDTLVMDGKSWSLLRKHATVTDLISMFYRRNLPGQQATSIDAAPRTDINQAQFVGTLNGRIDLYVYDAYYQDDNGADQPYLPDYTVLGIARGAIEGRQYFGAIIDLDAGMRATKLFSKSDKKFNPSGLEIVSQSAPLVAPRRANAMFKLTVK